MHDIVIRNGLVVDGTGTEPVKADIAIDGDTIVAIGEIKESGQKEIDAAGHIVTPGFVDVHTHLDAQIGWDPQLTPISWHGVTTALLDPLRDRVTSGTIETPEQLIDALRDEMLGRLAGADRSLHRRSDEGPSVWLIVGVNGVGKTTTIGKLAARESAAGTTVLLAAGDTFRAAAAEQLSMWAERSGSEFVRGAEGGDPSSVIFDGVERAGSRGIELVLADTAGRLHNKQNLMDELAKVRRVAEKGAGVVTETLLVIDATTGQNGLAQARQFHESTAVTGVVVTKLDGSAKGGIVFAVETELGIPVKYVGVGETIDDLVPFDPAEFVDALIGR